MIEIHRSKDEIRLEGHAHYAEPGKDTVRAGVSTLVQTLIQSIEELTQYRCRENKKRRGGE